MTRSSVYLFLFFWDSTEIVSARSTGISGLGLFVKEEHLFSVWESVVGKASIPFGKEYLKNTSMAFQNARCLASTKTMRFKFNTRRHLSHCSGNLSFFRALKRPSLLPRQRLPPTTTAPKPPAPNQPHAPPSPSKTAPTSPPNAPAQHHTQPAPPSSPQDTA